MRAEFAERLRCPQCAGKYTVRPGSGEALREGVLVCACGAQAPVIEGVPRILPQPAVGTLVQEYPAFFERHAELRPLARSDDSLSSTRTLRAFGDEWRRFPDILPVHEELFDWYFEGGQPIEWPGLRVLDAGCGMGRWLHFARRAGADVVGMDVSTAIDVAAARDGGRADFVQADLLQPPFAPETFDLVYSFGVLHHLEDPEAGVRALATLIRPGGELRLYLYRTLDGEPWWRRSILWVITLLRRITTRLPYWAVHFVAWLISLAASLTVIWPRRFVRRWGRAYRSTAGLPLAHYTDAPFRMLVSEQFDRLVAPIEGRFCRDDIERWLRSADLEVVDLLPDLGWRAIGRRRAMKRT